MGGGGQVAGGAGSTAEDEAVVIESFPLSTTQWRVTAKVTTNWVIGHHIVVTAWVVCSQ